MKDDAYETAEGELTEEAHDRKVKALKQGIKTKRALTGIIKKVDGKIEKIKGTPAEELEGVRWPDINTILF